MVVKMDADALLDLTPAQRAIYARKARYEAKRDAEYARINLRHTLMKRSVEVESLNDRWRREAVEQERERLAQQRRAERAKELAAERAHQVALAQATADKNAGGDIDLGGLLTSIRDAIGALADPGGGLENRNAGIDND